MTPVVALVQARMSSSRLSGKVLLPLGGRTVLDQVVSRAGSFAKQVIVCTSTDPEDDAIEVHCNRSDVLCVRGSLDDVFSRFRKALANPRTINSAWFARVTADCPLLSDSLARMLIARIDPCLDYISIPPDTLPRGLAPELVRRQAFEAIDHEALDRPQREHVTLALYETDGYRCATVAPPAQFCHPELRLTLDYPEDYELLRVLFNGKADISAEEAIAMMLADKQLRAINQDCTQKPARSIHSQG